VSRVLRGSLVSHGSGDHDVVVTAVPDRLPEGRCVPPQAHTQVDDVGAVAGRPHDAGSQEVVGPHGFGYPAHALTLIEFYDHELHFGCDLEDDGCQGCPMPLPVVGEPSLIRIGTGAVEQVLVGVYMPADIPQARIQTRIDDCQPHTLSPGDVVGLPDPHIFEGPLALDLAVNPA